MTSAATLIEETARRDSGRILASLIGTVRDFTLAEDALQDAMVAALELWPSCGVPANRSGWLLTVARRRAIDRLRRNATLSRKQAELQTLADIDRQAVDDPRPRSDAEIPDARLRLFFTCCHPALALESRIALTLRTLAGLTTAEIASAFLVPLPTMSQRLVRAQRKIRDARIPYEVPALGQLGERMVGVLSVLYLVFNEGYVASAGDTLVRKELCQDAIRLTTTLIDLIEHDATVESSAEALGLLALMHLHHARSRARLDAGGDLVVLEAQDRALWDQEEVDKGVDLLDRAMTLRRPGPYQLQAAIAALHAQARQPEDTDWRQISLLYSRLAVMEQSPVVELNYAVAVAMASGAACGLALMDQLHLESALNSYHHYHSARGELQRRAGHFADALASYERALALCQNEIERRYIQRRLAELSGHEKTPTGK